MRKQIATNFVISGRNNNGVFGLKVEDFFPSSKANGTIVIARVNVGQVCVNDEISISIPGKENLYDMVKTIQLDGKPLGLAVKGELIGICLKTTGMKELRRFNEPADGRK